MAVLVFSHTDPNHVSTSSVYWPAFVCETTLASFGASRAPVILITLDDQLYQTTAIQLMNLMFYMISEQSFDNYLYLEWQMN